MSIVTVSENWKVTVLLQRLHWIKNMCHIIIFKLKLSFEEGKDLEH